MKKAVILLSGGLDSTTVLAIAKKEGYDCYALSFDYGQRHKSELQNAQEIANSYNVTEHKIAKIDLTIFAGSSLTSQLDVKKNSLKNNKEIPNTYVAARNTIFLSYAIAYAETIKAENIFIGVNAVDYSNYPDCRPEFIAAYENMANLATAISINGEVRFKINSPLINLSKNEIIKYGISLGVDYSKTHSCYDPILVDGEIFSCAECDSCLFRLQAFQDLGIKDEIKYLKKD